MDPEFREVDDPEELEDATELKLVDAKDWVLFLVGLTSLDAALSAAPENWDKDADVGLRSVSEGVLP